MVFSAQRRDPGNHGRGLTMCGADVSLTPMNVELVSPVFDRLEISRDDLLADMAVGLYMDRRVTLGQAAEIAGLSQFDFRRLLGRLNVPIQYDIEDLHHDLAVLRERGVE